jgi:hypothetical protein
MRPWLVLVLVGTLLALTPLAHGTPPDPTWIGGFYDDADFDDVVQSLTSSSAIGCSNPAPRPTPLPLIGIALLADDGDRADARRASHAPRAPPTL